MVAAIAYWNSAMVFDPMDRVMQRDGRALDAEAEPRLPLLVGADTAVTGEGARGGRYETKNLEWTAIPTLSCLRSRRCERAPRSPRTKHLVP